MSQITRHTKSGGASRNCIRAFIIYFIHKQCVFSGDTTEEVSRKFNKDLALSSNWLNCNKLKLKVDKTKCMIITNKKIQKDEIMMTDSWMNMSTTFAKKWAGNMAS
jgi:hypothetical protein